MLTGEEILAALGKHIIIYPFDPDELRGSNYNLKVGRFVWLHPGPGAPSPVWPLEGVLTATGRRFDIPPGALVSVLTEEVVYVDDTVAGLFHSKVDMVTKGFSHISTTLDPCWIGPLLITMQNCSATTLALWQGETFVKLSFHRLSRPTKVRHNNPPGRADRLKEQGFRFPEGQEDFLYKPINYKLDALRRAFFASEGWKEIQNRKTLALSQYRRWAAWILVFAVLIGAVTARWWFPLIFGIPVGDEAIAAMLGVVVGVVLSFILHRSYQ